MKTNKFFYILLLTFMLNFMLLPQTIRKAFVNGKVYTVDSNNKWAETIITENNKLLFVGSAEEAKKFITKQTEIIDLKGKLVLPGFIDDHTHFMGGGFYLMGLDLFKAKSIEEFKSILREYLKDKPGKWITGGNWDHERWNVKELPTKEMIDNFSENNPVFIRRYDGHMALANSVALKLAGITKETKSPEGGLIVKDKLTGEPTGILKDNAMDLVSRIIPPKSPEDYAQALQAALKHAASLGVTSVEDITNPEDLIYYQQFEKENKLTVRIYTRLPIDLFDNMVKLGIQYNFGSDKLQIGSLKAYADGSLGSSTAWFFDHYSQDTTTFGLPNDIITDGRFKTWAIDADKHKLQISVHAIGDRANSFVLDTFDEISKTNPKWNRRFRIEHAQHIQPKDFARFRNLNVIASVQPHHLIEDGVWAEKRIGKERTKYTHPYKSFLDSSVTLAFGTDWPVVSLNPLIGIFSAVTRETVDGKNPNGWIPEQKISLEDAIKCYTLNSAYAAFQENVKGSLTEGKLADFIVLDKNLFLISPDEIKNAKVLMTVFDGNIIYNKMK